LRATLDGALAEVANLDGFLDLTKPVAMQATTVERSVIRARTVAG
jgi:hypothetical protein